MGFAEILLIAIGLAMDAFAVALAAGGSGQASGPRAAFRLSFHFGLFQLIMPIIGWYAGSRVAPWFARFDHWVAFVLLGIVGLRMIRAGLGPESEMRLDPSRGLALVGLSIATSIDALAVGFGLAMLRIEIWYPSVVIGIVAAGLSWVGLHAGGRLGKVFGKRMEILGGVVLLAIGLRILVQHLV